MKTFQEANEILRQYWPMYHKRHLQTLDHIREFMDFLGNPQDKLKVIHVAGTSGKTSTAYYAAGLLKASGQKVGLAISPHVDEINERVQINGRPLGEKRFCQDLEEYLRLVKQSGVSLNYFEIMYTFALWQFVRQGVEYAVVEVGVGGLLDSTNVIDRSDKICVITDIGMDHMRLLGDSLGEIASHKAGIIQLHNPVFCYRQAPAIMDEIGARAKQRQADLHVLDRSAEQTELSGLPLFQQRNLGLARAAAAWALRRDFDQKLTKAAVEQAARTHIPGRMEIFKRDGKTVVVDVAHNAQKFEALRKSLKVRFDSKPVAALVSLIAGRDQRLDDAAKQMATLADHLIITSFSGPEDGPHHSADPKVLEKLLKQHGAKSVAVLPQTGLALETLLARPEPVLLVAGSFYLLNHIRPLLRR